MKGHPKNRKERRHNDSHIADKRHRYFSDFWGVTLIPKGHYKKNNRPCMCKICVSKLKEEKGKNKEKNQLKNNG